MHGIEEPPRPGRGLVKRAAIAALLISLMAAAAVSAAGLLELDDLKNEFIQAAGDGRAAIPTQETSLPEPGKPQTIMVLGTDRRMGNDALLDDSARSDTIILARLDADKSAITLMSIPRDLKVDIPGHYSDRINAAFAEGGANLTLKTVKNLLSTPDRPFKINHVIEVSFHGFRTMVDYLGCTYVDIDERYFNDRGGPGGFATIDIEPGYQKLCGKDALDYVRYRHTDNDLVRGARQQDFIRQMLRQRGVRSKLNFAKRKVLAHIAGRFTRTDKSLLESNQLVSLLKLGLNVAEKPIQEVPFGEGRIVEDGPYLTLSQNAIEDTVDDFLNAKPLSTPRVQLKETPKEKKFSRKSRRNNKSSVVPGLEIAKTEGENQAISAARKIDFPFYFPELRVSGSHYAGTAPRTYTIKDELGHKHDAYRMVVALGPAGEYYGVQGMTWKAPPILDGPHDTITNNGRKLMIYYDGRRVRLVAWRTKRGVYWVHNTLARTVRKQQLVGIAASLRRLGH